MARHFLGLYLLIVLTLAAVSWGQDKLLEMYGGQDPADDRALGVAMTALATELQELPAERRQPLIARVAAKSGAAIELFKSSDIAGAETLRKLERGGVAYLQSDGEAWTLIRLDADQVLAYRSLEAQSAARSPLEWALTALFYGAMALVIMLWIWPLTRDLRTLERAAARFGNRNWAFELPIKPRSQIYALAQTFRKMATRIDGLIASHKDMSNAVSHEIKTPLARMQFEIELAQRAASPEEMREALSHIKTDIEAIDQLVTATLNYAILERADLSLNLGAHDFTALVPAIADDVRRNAPRAIEMRAEVDHGADRVVCDAHLLEVVLKNLLGNAARYARREVRVSFDARDGINRLVVEDDGPGIPEEQRQRVFESFVQLDHAGGPDGGSPHAGFGLGLAIVKRAIEWHHGEVRVSQSPLGGARFAATWPALARDAPAAAVG